MDLRSVLNTSDHGPPKGPPAAQQQQQQQQPAHPQSRMTQSPVQYSNREYPPAQHQQPHPSPGRPMNHEYPHASPRPQTHSKHPSNSYPPPVSPYQQPGPFATRPHPPPLQPTNAYYDVRSPSAGSMPGPSPSRQQSSSAASGGSGGYPFPPQNMQSPSQRHQYPPAHYQQPPQQQQPLPQHRRDSFSNVPPQGQPPYPQQPVPHTPPTGATGGQPYQFPNQRSQSTHSASTPTSAQSQHQFGPPFPHGSPVVSTHHLPNDYNRQASQPPTPLGPPMPVSAGSRPGPAGSFAQPSSPYQQRQSSTPIAQAARASPQVPTGHLPQRKPSNHSVYESPSREAHRPSILKQEREHSLSVSPKTRVPSLPSSAGRPSVSAEPQSAATSGAGSMSAAAAQAAPQMMDVDTDRATTPAKRKLGDRDLSPRELERKEPRPPPGEVNGDHRSMSRPPQPSPDARKRKRMPRSHPPIWAQNIRSLGKQLPSHANFVLQKRLGSHLNGKVDGAVKVKVEQSSRQSPEATRGQNAQQRPPSPPEAGPQDVLGPWEASILGVKPYEEVSKAVADFLFLNVITNPDIQEILSRGIQFEVEAKLGRLIDKDTNQRVNRMIGSECILPDNGRTAFKSSMTERYHKSYNDFLNQLVAQTHPRNPQSGGKRVPVEYTHRREIDRFFELPPQLQDRLPGCVRARVGSRSRGVRVRVSYDQKTGDVLAKIVKARVADFDIHFASSPLDCRISVNLEMNWDGPVEELESVQTPQAERQPDRNKDRLSYKQGHYQIDLTQVTQTLPGPGSSQRVEKEHELEIEMSSTALLEQGRRAASGAPHRYPELVEALVDNVRVLSRKASEYE